MAQIYRMPAVSPTMEAGMITAWKIAVGQKFSSGAVIAEVGTDKATMEAEIFDDGVLLAQLVPEGDEVPVDGPMAIFGTSADEDFSELLAQAKAELKGGPATQAEAPKAAPEAPKAAPAPKVPEDEPTDDDTTPPAKTSEPPPDAGRAWMGKPLPADFLDPATAIAAPAARVAASPLARKVADDLGVDLRKVKPTGVGGRIVRDDVEAAAKAPAPAAGPARRADTTIKLTPMRRTIAKRLLQSHQDIPTFYLTVTFDVSGFVQLRAALKAQLPDLSVSYNDMLVAAVARALRETPRANSSYTDQGIIEHGRVDIGIAVALPEGLITPVLRDADTLRLGEIGAKVRDLATRAKAGKLAPDEYQGGTFTISNLGMMGIEHFTAIINPPEAAILAVGAVAEVPVVHDGQLTKGWRMSCTLTCDHRVLDGAGGAAFLATLRRYVETPALLLA